MGVRRALLDATAGGLPRPGLSLASRLRDFAQTPIAIITTK
ncbi:hypothetical protein [Nonomuraea turkmeniaca]|nr:hypothetical protein [Nonomuraea turkmeniaca]